MPPPLASGGLKMVGCGEPFWRPWRPLEPLEEAPGGPPAALPFLCFCMFLLW